MIPESLLAILRCPIDGQLLEFVDLQRLSQLQERQADGSLRDENDGRVEDSFDQALITQDGSRVYPIRHGIPTLIPSESIPTPADLRR